jgi:hypothetical protein
MGVNRRRSDTRWVDLDATAKEGPELERERPSVSRPIAVLSTAMGGNGRRSFQPPRGKKTPNLRIIPYSLVLVLRTHS